MLHRLDKEVMEGSRTFLINKVYLKFAISPYLMSLLVFVAEDIWLDIPKPDSMSATAFHPLRGCGLMSD